MGALFCPPSARRLDTVPFLCALVGMSPPRAAALPRGQRRLPLLALPKRGLLKAGREKRREAPSQTTPRAAGPDLLQELPQPILHLSSQRAASQTAGTEGGEVPSLSRAGQARRHRALAVAFGAGGFSGGRLRLPGRTEGKGNAA